MERYFGEATPKLGFGLMRLPRKLLGIDVEQTKRMVDLFLDAGLTYFDTAFVYSGSEEATRKALVERHPRDSYTLASKLNAWLGKLSVNEAKKELHTSLKRLGTDYLDYYLLHAIQNNNYELYDRYGLWDYVREQKQAGLIRHWGFSFHGTPELLDELLTKNPDAEFVQLQLNYADWEDPKIASRRCYETARRHGKSIVVMEPVKGGALAKPPREVQQLFQAAAPEASCASWAIRFAASLDGILTVLSGMSNEEQMRDNLSFMRDFKPLSDAEQETIRAAQEALGKIEHIPCTACHYCTEGCPQGIPIPDIFSARNKQLIWGQIERGAKDYQELAAQGNVADACIACGQCESACPQGIRIIDRLAECAENFKG
ncbi:MAG: aldo/keto reductase [Oscillospiraceae bacterium]|nr:aldo/keto reductase [Oscillospiraceae bacterium]